MDITGLEALVEAISDAQYEKQVAEMKLVEAKERLAEKVIEARMWNCISINMPAVRRIIRQVNSR
jgi:hypothetical protein